MSAPAYLPAFSTGALTPLAGRERELAELLALLRQPDSRLITVSGPGGVGKTRLARQVAAEAEGDFVDGVAFVSLDPIRDPSLVVATIAQALGLREPTGQSWFDLLVTALHDRQLLLILDNFEQIVDAAPVVSDLLTACPRLKMLVTSREYLRLTGELDVPLAPLGLPAPGNATPFDEIVQSDAVRLFVQRAEAASPAFQLTPENAATVAEICRRLDGLPLAIELAASRIKVLSPRALLARLEQRLILLTGGARDLPARLQTMRDAIAWSYDLMTPDEQSLFRRVSVFSGSFTETAAAVVGARGWGLGAREENASSVSSPQPLTPSPLIAPDVFDGLSSLVEKSLLRPVDEGVGGGGEARFSMLETVREFGVAVLAECDEEVDARRQHAWWMLDLLDRAEPELVGPRQEEWLDRLETERDNARAALSWAIKTRDAEIAQRLTAALWRFWVTRGYLTEGRNWTERALELGQSETVVTAKAFHHLGNLSLDLGDYDRARYGYESGLALWKTIDNPRGLASSYNGLGLLAFYQADYAEARRLHETSLALRRELDDRLGLGNSFSNLGNVANAERNYAEARELHEQALAVRQGMGDTGAVAFTLFNLADVARQQVDIQRARQLLDQCLALFQEVGDKLGVGYALTSLGLIAHLQGRDNAAAAKFAEAIQIRQELGDKRGLVECLQGLAPVAHRLGDLDLAGALFGAVEVHRELLDVPLPPTEQAVHTAEVDALKQAVGEAQLSVAWAIGRAMTLDEAIAAARSLTITNDAESPVRVATRVTRTTGRPVDFGLSEREREVLRHLAQGQTDREIAELLSISPRTVNVHVANLRGKLGVSSRAAVVALAHRHNLI